MNVSNNNFPNNDYPNEPEIPIIIVPYHPPQLSIPNQTQNPALTSRYLRVSSVQSNLPSKVMHFSEGLQERSAQPTPSSPKLIRKYKSRPLYHTKTLRSSDAFISDDYSLILSSTQTDHDEIFHYARLRDLDLAVDKYNFFLKFTSTHFRHVSYGFQHFPFFLNKIFTTGRRPLEPAQILKITKGDNLLHYLTTHAGRRAFARLPSFYHLHVNWYDILFPEGMFIDTNPVTRECFDCRYLCGFFAQNCSWHQGREYSPRTANNRQLLYNIMTRLNLFEDVSFFLSIGAFLADRSVEYPPLKVPGFYAPVPTILNMTGYMSIPDLRCLHIDAEQWWNKEEDESKILQTIQAKQEIDVVIEEDENIPEESSVTLLSYTREFLTTKLSDLLQVIGDTTEALPLWIKTHTRFIINLVCNCINVIASPNWVGVTASLSSIVNEIVHEFPTLLQSNVTHMINCLKQVISRFFLHVEAAPSADQDNRAANESFIASVFGILASILPGTQVEAGLLKARIERIKTMSVVLQSVKSIGEWFTVLFDKFWTWVQIYYYGVTSEQLSKQRALINSPEIQLWINDVSAFELGTTDNDGTTYPAQATQILSDEETQEKVVELKRRGEEFLKVLNLGDSLKNSGVSRLVSANLKKIDKWYSMFADIRGAIKNKHEPFVIYLYGDPGIGKTYCVNYICQVLARAHGRTYDPAKDLFSKPRDSEYFDGYNHQFCFLLDDFLQISDDAVNAAEISFLIDAGSRAKLHLNMANCDRKSNSYFESPLIMITANKKMVPQSFETKIQSFPALARRVDLMVEVRRQKGVAPKSDAAFDSEGLFFHPMFFELDSEAADGGYWRSYGPPCTWDVFTGILSILFTKKMRHQERLDVMDPIGDDESAHIEQIVNDYAHRNDSKLDIITDFVNENCQNDNINWKLYGVSQYTNLETITRVPVITYKNATLNPSSSMSLRSDAAQKLIRKGGAETLPRTKETAHLPEKTFNDKLKPYRFRKTSSDEEEDQLGPLKRVPITYEDVADLVTPNQTPASSVYSIHCESEEYDCEEKIIPATSQMSIASISALSSTSPETVPDSDTSFQMRKRLIKGKMRRRKHVIQSGEPVLVPCSAGGCGALIPEVTPQSGVFSHMLKMSLCQDATGDSHRSYNIERMEMFLSKFPDTLRRVPLKPDEHEWYAFIQERFTDYHPMGSPWTMSELLLLRKYDLVRSMITHYRKFEHHNILSRLLEWPWNKVKQMSVLIHRAVYTAIDSATRPVMPLVNAVKDANLLLGKISSGIKKAAVIGVVFTLASAVVSMIRARLHTKSYAEAFTSGDLRTDARRRKQFRRIEEKEETEAFVSGDLLTHARRRNQRRIECKYVSSVVIPSYTASVTMKRVDPNDEHDVIIAAAGNEAELHWTDGTVDQVKAPSRHGRDLQISAKIVNHLKEDGNKLKESPSQVELSSAPFEVEPRTSQKARISSQVELSCAPSEVESRSSNRDELVKELIAKIPIKEAEAAIDPNAMDVMRNISPQIFRVTHLQRAVTLHGLFLGQHFAMIPRHILGDVSAEGTQLFLNTAQGSFTATLGKNACPYEEVPEKDTLFVDFRTINLPARRDMTHLFITDDEEVKKCDGYLCTLDVKKERFVFAKSLHAIEPVTRAEYHDNIVDRMLYVIGALNYLGNTEAGDCGAIIVRCDAHAKHKLMGIHVAGAVGAGTGIIWTQEKLKPYLEKFKITQAAMKVEFSPINDSDFFECDNSLDEEDTLNGVIGSVPVRYCELLGMIPKELAPGAPLTTKLVPSPIHGKVIETKSGPSTLRPFTNSAGERKFPLKLAIEKLESPMIQFDRKLVEKVVKRMIVDYATRGYLKPYSNAKQGKLTEYEMLSGSPDDEWIKPVNMKTSPGYPFILKGGKEHFMSVEDATMADVLRSALEEREKKARDGEPMPALIVDVLKDERLSNEKREKGKVRIFNVCPLDYNLLVRKYFTRFLAQMMNFHSTGEVSVGINPHNASWEVFYDILKKSGDHWIAGDYSAWDKRAPVDIALGVLPLVEYFYRQFDDYDPKDAVVRRTLILQAYQSIRLSQSQGNGLIYRCHQSMPSGIAITAVYNSLVNSLLFRVIFVELAVQSGKTQEWAINSYGKYVRFAAYGDDHVARVSNVVFPFFNMLSISHQMASHGITYTSATKDEVSVPEVQEENLTYLKRRFVHRGARLDAPMELDAVLDILNWVNASDPLDVNDACASAVRSVLIELSHHDRQIFQHWSEQIYRACIPAQIDCPIVGYDYMVNRRREESFDLFDDFV